MAVTMDEIQQLVGAQLGLREVGADSLLVEELGAESADLLNLVAALEDRYGILIAEEEIEGIRTVLELYRLVRQRIP